MTAAGSATRRWSRYGRLLVACIALLALAALYLPQLAHVATVDARLNARVLPVESPIDGRLELAPPPVGTALAAGAELARIVDPEASSAVLEELDTEIAILRGRAAALRGERAALGAMRVELDAAAARYRHAVRFDVEARLAAAAARRDGALATLQLAVRTLERTTRLAGPGVVSGHRLDEARAQKRARQAELNVAMREVQRLRRNLDAVRSGVALGDGHNDAPYSAQRADEIEIRRITIARALDDITARLAALEREHDRKAVRLRGLARAVLRAPVDGVLWRSDLERGNAGVARGDAVQLIDCRSRIVTASLPTRRVERFAPGMPARIRLLGTRVWLDAHVDEIRAMGAETGADLLAAVPPHLDDRHVLVTLRPHALPPAASARFCDVGRRVEVRLRSGALVDGAAAWHWAVARAAGLFEAARHRDLATATAP